MTKRIDRSLLAQQVGPLLGLLAELEPTLETEAILAAIREAAALPAGRRRIAQEVVDRPDLLLVGALLHDIGKGRAALSALREAASARPVVRRAAALRRLHPQGRGHAVRSVREATAPGAPQRQRPPDLPGLLVA